MFLFMEKFQFEIFHDAWGPLYRKMWFLVHLRMYECTHLSDTFAVLFIIQPILMKFGLQLWERNFRFVQIRYSYYYYLVKRRIRVTERLRIRGPEYKTEFWLINLCGF